MSMRQHTLPGESESLQAVIDFTQDLDRHVQDRARASQIGLPELAFAPAALGSLGPKYPARTFCWRDELDGDQQDAPAGDAELLDEVARFFKGAIRPQSGHALFNMVPAPSVESTAAAWLTTAYNANSLMDFFGGESLLIEQKVARCIGRWAGWPQAMGISSSGGKLTIMYAIKSALSRIAPESLCSGLPGDLVILCSEGAHYCVEHAASLLGLGSDNCLRVPGDGDGRMCRHALLRILYQQHARGRRVAAIVCCGGTTINFNCDNTQQIVEIVDLFVREQHLQQRPWLHLDSVIGWLYLSLLNVGEEQLRHVIPDARSRQRMTEVQQRLQGLRGFDSLGVDFHKNGLCPYASSFFIARDRHFMDLLGDGHYHYGETDFQSGKFRAYRYTFENSRSGQGILAAWINLRRLGRAGYADYLVSLHQARNALVDALERHGLFRVLNQASLGWEVVFEVPFAPDLIALAPSRQELAQRFMQECWDRVNAGYDLPLFSIVPGYQIGNDANAVTTGFLLYPMRPRQDAEWDETVALIAAQFDHFQTRMRAQQRKPATVAFEKPIR
ncbi:pyridoxal phosphate-dependent decarboxylase family protein [Erwinia pyrifoliae]|uniref:pyridoxal phosphate-dependent decarboxylase family protein n=1 Tax=Erwinia pyrifoliae TaxID=79967 RepID=UPI00223A8E68|nr:pyridoxal-dependent decarboxylase [Erwinia pyrifoliae]MCT2386582.1 pyridoxal-dependent decarboxylase [Erwinia pyrifoliae]MCU8587821.1 pyridoxal-dependent decarboxylase [Erwinia pyrifoliae]